MKKTIQTTITLAVIAGVMLGFMGLMGESDSAHFGQFIMQKLGSIALIFFSVMMGRECYRHGWMITEDDSKDNF